MSHPLFPFLVIVAVILTASYAKPFVAEFSKPEAGKMSQEQKENARMIYVAKLKSLIKQDVSASWLCTACEAVVSLGDGALTGNHTFELIYPYVVKICIKILDAEGKNGTFLCPNIIRDYGPVYIYVIARVVLQPRQVCIDLGLCSRSRNKRTYLQLHDLINVPPLRLASLPRVKKTNNKKSYDPHDLIRVAVISDAHIAYNYAQGASTDCGLFGCCLKGFPGNGSAGEWGDYNCDVPPKTVHLLADYIKTLEPSPDFIIYGGDSPAHHIYEQTWSLQLNQDKLFNDFLLANMSKWTIYPVLGNHESFPNSCYYQKSAPYQSLTAKLAEWWRPLFNMTEEQVNTIAHSGYYTALVRPGLRVLAYNSDYWLVPNPYFLLNAEIPAFKDQLEFMNRVLTDARKNNEKVIMAAHVPAADIAETSVDYGEIYTDLATRYSDVIVLQVFGHTHYNQIAVVSNPLSREPVGVQFVVGALTTYTQVNPSFAVFYLDKSTFELVDFDLYYMNISKANEGKPEVKLQLSAKKDYGLSDMTANSFSKLTQRFEQDPNFFSTYVRAYYSQSPFWQRCDKKCRTELLCATKGVTTRLYDNCIKNIA